LSSYEKHAISCKRSKYGTTTSLTGYLWKEIPTPDEISRILVKGERLLGQNECSSYYQAPFMEISSEY
jgi:hypothetical protein